MFYKLHNMVLDEMNDIAQLQGIEFDPIKENEGNILECLRGSVIANDPARIEKLLNA